MGLGVKIVGGFNWFVGLGAKAKVMSYVPEVVKKGLEFYVQQGAKDPKRYFMKPMALIGPSIKYFEWAWVPDVMKRHAVHGAVAKGFVQAWECVTKGQKALRAVSETVGAKKVRADRAIMVGNGVTLVGRKLTNGEVVARRVWAVADWVIAWGDAVSEWHRCAGGKDSSFVGRVAPIAQSVAGIYMSLQGLYDGYQEKEHTKAKSGDEGVNIPAVETWYSRVLIVMNLTYLMYGGVALAGIYYGKEGPNMIARLQFWASVGVTVMPIVTDFAKKRADDEKPAEHNKAV